MLGSTMSFSLLEQLSKLTSRILLGSAACACTIDLVQPNSVQHYRP